MGSARDRSEVSSPFRQSHIERGPRGLRREPRSAARSPSDSLARDERDLDLRNRYSEEWAKPSKGHESDVAGARAATNGPLKERIAIRLPNAPQREGAPGRVEALGASWLPSLDAWYLASHLYIHVVGNTSSAARRGLDSRKFLADRRPGETEQSASRCQTAALGKSAASARRYRRRRLQQAGLALSWRAMTAIRLHSSNRMFHCMLSTPVP